MIGKKLVELRGNKTQEEVAKALGISRARYAHYEQERSEPNLELLEKIANYYKTTIDFITGKETMLKESIPSDEVTELLETLHKRPEMKALFSISKNATKDDIEKAIKIIEALREPQE